MDAQQIARLKRLKEIADSSGAAYGKADLGNSTPINKTGGNFLTRLLPTAGGIGGSLAGAAGGAAIGSVVPVVGTAVGGILGAILGGAAGSGAGKFGENFAEGESDLGKGVVNEALLGGATSLPIGAAFKLARAGTKVATGLGGKAAGTLVQEAGAKVVPKKFAQGLAGNVTDNAAATTAAQQTVAGGSKFSLTSRATDLGNKALTSQYGTIGKPIARATNPTKTIGELADIGITKPADVERIAGGITGSEGLVNKAVVKAVGSANGVNTDSLRGVFNDALANHGVVGKEAKSLQTLFDAQMNRLSGGAKGSLSATVNPTDALSVMKSFEKRIADLSGKGSNYKLTDPARLDQASVLKLVRDELEDGIYKGAGADKNLSKVLTPELRQSLISLHPGNKQFENFVDKKIMGAKSIGELRTAQKNFVNASKIIDEGDVNAITAGGRVGNAFSGGGVVNGVKTLVTGALMNGPVARTAGTALRGIGGAGAEKAATQVAADGSGSALRSILGAGVRQYGGRQILGAGANMQQGDPNASLDPSVVDPTQATDPNPLDDTSMGQENPFGASSDEFAQGYAKALQAGDTKAAAQLKDLYEGALDYETKQAKSSYNSTTQKALSQSANGSNTLDQLEQLLQAAGGAGGPIGGRISTLLGDAGISTGAKAYNDLVAGSVTQIAKALGETGTLSETDQKVYRSLLPSLTDTAEVAQIKLKALKQRLAVAQQNTMQFGAGVDETSVPTM
jgi:hypothetical protein